MNVQISRSVKILLISVVVVLVMVLISAFARYMLAKEYDFFVEAPCDADTELCFIRSCDDYCPPNQLESYKTYRISAADFKFCTDNSCQNICESAEVTQRSLCSEVPCDLENGDECTR